MQFEKQASSNGQPGLLPPDLLRPGRGRSYLWRELTGPLPRVEGPPQRLAPCLP